MDAPAIPTPSAWKLLREARVLPDLLAALAAVPALARAPRGAGEPKYTTAGASYRRRGIDVDALERELAARDAALPIRVPVHAIYSRRDGVVAWQACIDRVSPDVEHVEVASTHSGLGFDARVYALVAERLARRRPAGGG